MAEQSNGNVKRPMFTWTVGGIAAAGLAVAGAIFGFIASVDKEVDAHKEAVGHVGIIERVDAIKDDVAEIKADVKTILRNGNGHSHGE